MDAHPIGLVPGADPYLVGGVSMEPVSAALLLAKIAPDIIGWIKGDKAKSVAEKVVDVATELTGLPNPREAAEAVIADPSLAMQFRERMAAMEVEVLRMELADVQNARQRDVEIRKAGGENSRANWMIAGDVVGLVVCLVVLTAVPELPGEVRGIIGTIAGFFGLGLRDAHTFEFGSSRGSKAKDDLLLAAKGRD